MGPALGKGGERAGPAYSRDCKKCSRPRRWDSCFLQYAPGMEEERAGLVPVPGLQMPRTLWGGVAVGACTQQRLFPQVYSSMERLSLLEERRAPPPTKRSLSEEKDDRSDGLAGLKGQDRSWVIGSPEM